METKLDPKKRYTLEEAINFVINSPTVSSDMLDEVGDVDIVDEFANEELVEKNENEDENSLNLFSVSAINTMFDEASDLVKSVNELFDTKCEKGTMTDREFDKSAGIMRIPHKEISNNMIDYEDDIDDEQEGIDEDNDGEQEGIDDKDDEQERMDENDVDEQEGINDDEREQRATEQNEEQEADPPAKKKKRLTLTERSAREKEKHAMLPRNECSKHRCKHQIESSNKYGGAHDEGCLRCEDVDEASRVFIHDQYWNGGYTERITWINGMIDSSEPKRRRKNNKEASDRKMTAVYHLYANNMERVRVCQKMFLSTLGYTCDRVVRVALEKSKNKLFPSPDKRGRNSSSNRLSDEKVTLIRNHILSYNPAITHYRRKHAPNRLYISPVHSTSSMLNDFNETYNLNISRSRYYQEIKSMNISFVKLGEEECEDCDLHDKHLIDDHGLKDEKERCKTDATTKKSEQITITGCKKCDTYTCHIKFANESREGYRRDREMESEEGRLIVSADLQKVIMLPVLPGLKKAIFCKRIVLFNETFAPVGGSKNGKPVGMLWHEGLGGRKAEDVASVFLTYLRKFEDIDEIVLWLDNCSAQGKNWWLFAALVSEVNMKDGNFITITLKYFEPGHTFMSADSFHHLVEQGMRIMRRLQNFADFVKIVNEKGLAHEMTTKDFRVIPRGLSSAQAIVQTKPLLENCRIIEFRRGSYKMYWKTSHVEKYYHSSEFLKTNLKQSMKAGNDFPAKRVPRGVHTGKIRNIIEKLCPHMDAVKRKFWLDIPLNDTSPDLQKERDPNEHDEIAN